MREIVHFVRDAAIQSDMGEPSQVERSKGHSYALWDLRSILEFALAQLAE